MKELTLRKIKWIKKHYKLYDVGVSSRMFGCCWGWDTTVLADSPSHAVYRANKIKGIGIYHHRITSSLNLIHTTPEWATWKVKLHSDSDHFKNVTYFRD